MSHFILPSLPPLSHKPAAETRVVVAMSGGVDSSVVAAWLKHLGYEVIGITLQLYDHGAALQKKGACCAGQDIHDARRVAESINIPHYVLNYENRFREAVMEDFADSYLAGQTPIPCITCNQTVKFKDLLATARDLGADCMATGHYVQRHQGVKAELHRGIDPGKDQSYFLFATTQQQLDFLRFPLGGLTKDTTRAMAGFFGLPVESKPDSQDICFVPGGNYASVIAKLRPGALEAGDIKHVDGRLLGRHEGIIHYTVGQRRGLGITENSAGGEPLYVISMDAESHTVIVGPREALNRQRIELRGLNWLGETPLDENSQPVTVKLRSAHAGSAATIQRDQGGSTYVLLDTPEAAIAPGQACVAYAGDRLLGGGFITRTA